MKKPTLNIEYGVKSNFLPHILNKPLFGKVHSVFQSSFNIQFDNHLIHFGCLGMPLSAFGINIRRLHLKQLLQDIKIGDLVEYKEGFILFHSFGSIVHVNLNEFFEMDLRIKRVKITQERFQKNDIFKTIEGINFDTESGVIQSDTERKYIQSLVEKGYDDQSLVVDFIEHFLGRGIGLTPSGDDFLSGILMVESTFLDSTVFKETIKNRLKDGVTTPVSINYLNCLVRGYVSENFNHLLKNIFKEIESVKAQRILKNIFEYGHTSGIDTLFGIKVGLYCINKSALTI